MYWKYNDKFYSLYSDDGEIYCGYLEPEKDRDTNKVCWWQVKTPLSTSTCGTGFTANSLQDAKEKAEIIIHNECYKACKDAKKIANVIRLDRCVNLL